MVELTEKQARIYELKKSGMKQTDIARNLGCSRQNVSAALKNIESQIASGEEYVVKKKKDRNKHEHARTYMRRQKRDYNNYEGMDLSCLTDRQREILDLKMNGKKVSEIAKIAGTTSGNVCIILDRALCKLDNVKSHYNDNELKSYYKHKEDPGFLEKRRDYYKKYYADNLEQERARSRAKYKKCKKEVDS